MNYFKKVSAAIISASVLVSVAACTSNEAPVESKSNPFADVTFNTDIEVPTLTDVEETTPAAPVIESFTDVYGEQLPSYLNKQYVLDGEELSVIETNYYYIQTFSDLSMYASYYGFPTTEAGFIDLDAKYENIGLSDPSKELDTWGDFLVDYTESQIKKSAVLSRRAQEEGLELGDEDYEQIEGFFTDLETNMVGSTDLSLDEYLQLYFGDGCDKEKLTEVMCHLRMADLYVAKFVEEFDPGEDAMVPNIRYALFYAPSGSTMEELDAQREACSSLLAKCTDLDRLQTEGAVAYSNGTVYEYGDGIAVEKGKMVPEFEAWAWDEARKDGDIDMIFTEAYGYFVVGYLGRVEVSEDSKYEIAMSALYDEIDAAGSEYVLEVKGATSK